MARMNQKWFDVFTKSWEEQQNKKRWRTFLQEL
jgi:hypothetical protein